MFCSLLTRLHRCFLKSIHSLGTHEDLSPSSSICLCICLFYLLARNNFLYNCHYCLIWKTLLHFFQFPSSLAIFYLLGCPPFDKKKIYRITGFEFMPTILASFIVHSIKEKQIHEDNRKNRDKCCCGMLTRYIKCTFHSVCDEIRENEMDDVEMLVTFHSCFLVVATDQQVHKKVMSI